MANVISISDLRKARKLHNRIKFGGLDVSIENRKGSIRHWYDKATNTSGTTKMLYPYGYVRGSMGNDGDHVDVFIGPNENATHAFVIDQMRSPEFKEFDEQKVMLGFDDADKAKKAYLLHFDNEKFFGSMKVMPFAEFARKVLSTSERKPLVKGLTLSEFAERVLGRPLPAHAVLFTDQLIKAGPFIGPRGGKWADAKQTIPWKETKPKRARKAEPQSKSSFDKEPWQMSLAEYKEAAGKRYMLEGDRSRTPADIIELKKDGEFDPVSDYDAHTQKTLLGGDQHDKRYYEPAKDGRVTIYRAMTGDRIRPGDYVTNSKAYAEDHLAAALRGEGKVVAIPNVKLSELQAMNPNEFFYTPESITKHDSIESYHEEQARTALKEGKLSQAEFDKIHGKDYGVKKSLPTYFIKAGGPFIGPRGGKWKDPQHMIPWEEPKPKRKYERRPQEREKVLSKRAVAPEAALLAQHVCAAMRQELNLHETFDIAKKELRDSYKGDHYYEDKKKRVKALKKDIEYAVSVRQAQQLINGASKLRTKEEAAKFLKDNPKVYAKISEGVSLLVSGEDFSERSSTIKESVERARKDLQGHQQAIDGSLRKPATTDTDEIASKYNLGEVRINPNISLHVRKFLAGMISNGMDDLAEALGSAKIHHGALSIAVNAETAQAAPGYGYGARYVHSGYVRRFWEKDWYKNYLPSSRTAKEARPPTIEIDMELSYSFAHEFGHALMEAYSYAEGREKESPELYAAFKDAMTAIRDSSMGKRTAEGEKAEYWGSYPEVWARSFEQYVGTKLARKGKVNTLLTKTYYDDKVFEGVFHEQGEFARDIEPKLDKWLALARESGLLKKAFSYFIKAGGPYIGPRGGKWADPQHTIPWVSGTLAYASRTMHRGYSGQMDRVQDIIEGVKSGDDKSIKEAAKLMAKPLKGFTGVVIPAPRSNKGKAALLPLAEAIVKEGAGKKAVGAISRISAVESSRQRRKAGKPGLTISEHADTMAVDLSGIDKDAPIMLVDDMFTTGKTLLAAAKKLREAGHKGPIHAAVAGHYVEDPKSHPDPFKAVEIQTREEPVPVGTKQKSGAFEAELHHGTDAAPFRKFDKEKIGSATDPGHLGHAVYLSTDPNISRSNKTHIKAQVRLKKPLRISLPKWEANKSKLASEALGLPETLSGKALSDAAKKRGYDGIILDYSPVGYHHQEVAVFDSGKAKITEAAKKSARIISIADLRKAAEQIYYGPRGGKYLDPEHKIPYRERKGRAKGKVEAKGKGRRKKTEPTSDPGWKKEGDSYTGYGGRVKLQKYGKKWAIEIDGKSYPMGQATFDEAEKLFASYQKAQQKKIAAERRGVKANVKMRQIDRAKGRVERAEARVADAEKRLKEVQSRKKRDVDLSTTLELTSGEPRSFEETIQAAVKTYGADFVRQSVDKVAGEVGRRADDNLRERAAKAANDKRIQELIAKVEALRPPAKAPQLQEATPEEKERQRLLVERVKREGKQEKPNRSVIEKVAQALRKDEYAYQVATREAMGATEDAIEDLTHLAVEEDKTAQPSMMKAITRSVLKGAAGPFLFGFIDNFLLYLAGSGIDSALATMGFSAAAVAGLGNAVSDSIGQAASDRLEGMLDKIGLGEDEAGGVLSEKTEKRIKAASSVAGVFAGALAGMVPLLFGVSFGKSERYVIRRDLLFKASRPSGGGWHPIPGGKKGGFRRHTPKGYEYWYPEEQGAGKGARGTEPGKFVPREFSEAEFASGEFDKDPAHWQFVRLPGQTAIVGWSQGGVDPKSKHPVKIAGREHRLYQIVNAEVEPGWARLRNVNDPEDQPLIQQERVYPVKHGLAARKGGARTKPVWNPGEAPTGPKAGPVIGSEKKIPPYAESTAKPGSALSRVESGKYPVRTVRYFAEDADGVPRMRERQAMAMPDADKVKLIKEFAPMVRKIARQTIKSFGIEKTSETEADLQSAAMEGLLHAIDQYPGGVSFARHAKFLSDQYARLHAAREFAGGMSMPRRHARLIRGFIAARAEAARMFETDKPTAEQTARVWKLNKRDIHEGLITGKNEPLPMNRYGLRAGDIVTGKEQPGKVEWAEHLGAFIDGQAKAEGSEYFDSGVGLYEGHGVAGVGMSEHEKIIVRHDLDPILEDMRNYKWTEGYRTYKTDAAEIIKKMIGLDGEPQSAAAIAQDISIEFLSQNAWRPLSERAMRRMIPVVLERALAEIRRRTVLPETKGVIERAVGRAFPEQEAKRGLRWHDSLKARAKALTREEIRTWRHRQREILKRAEQVAIRDGDSIRAKAMRDAHERINSIGLRRARMLAAEFMLRTAPASAEWFRTAEPLPVEVPKGEAHSSIIVTRTHPVTGAQQRVRVHSLSDLRLRKSEVFGSVPDMGVIQMIMHYPLLSRLVFGSDDPAALAPTLDREVVLELMGML